MTDRAVVVTGASTGIGRATVELLVAARFHVFATVRTEVDRDGLVAEFGPQVTPLMMDLLDEDSVRAAGAAVCAAGPLFGLINNAGAALPGPLEYLPIDVFRRQLEINLTGQLLVTQVMLPALRRSSEEIGDARIVMIGSVGGRISGPILGAYQAAKHGLVGLTGALRAELAPFGIKVLLIEPGAIATPIWNRGAAAGEETRADNPEIAARYGRQLAGSGSDGRPRQPVGPAAAGACGGDHGCAPEPQSRAPARCRPGREDHRGNGSGATVPGRLPDDPSSVARTPVDQDGLQVTPVEWIGQ
jgi:NAD(P)-dependent dehydrogenase (short-subunit alcohol dehydrogenase family)